MRRNTETFTEDIWALVRKLDIWTINVRSRGAKNSNVMFRLIFEAQDK